MIFALYVIGSTAAIVIMSARLREARAELARLRGEFSARARSLQDECESRAQSVRDEYATYAHGITMSLACLLAGMAAAAWHVPHRARPADGGSNERH